MKKMPFNSLVRNLFTSRQSWIRALTDDTRDIGKECGHPTSLTIGQYARAFQRGDLANRIVRLLPEECWTENPDVFETEDRSLTEFETKWEELEKRFMFFAMLQRADVLSGVGRFGIILLGLDDGGDLSQPVEGMNEAGEKVGNEERQLLYLRPLDESLVRVISSERNTSNPRYGMPTEYEVEFEEPSTTKKVHWNRVFHLADNRTNSDVYGAPRLEVVFNRILDLHKIAGGSGEMFWKGGFPGLALETQNDLGEDDVDIDKTATKEQMDAYMNGLQRYIALVGMNAKSLAVQVADPGPHLEVQIRLIAMASAIPWRILMGAEVGQLAGSQDVINWNRRVARRREAYITPFVIRPFVNRLIALGVLPELGVGGLQVGWSDLNSPSDIDIATIAEKRTDALAKYVQAGADVLVPPFHYLTLVLKFSEEEANSIIEAAGDRLMETDSVDDGVEEAR